MENQFTTSLWGDEGFSAILSMKPIPEIIKIIIRDTSPPLYNIAEHIAFQLFGTSEVVIRGLSFFYYLMACIFVALIAKHIWGKKTAFFSFALTFLNPFFFIYAFEGRMYSIMALGVAASMYFFITHKWKLYILATLWALYSHHFAIFAIFLQGLWFIKEFVAGDKKLAKRMFKNFIFIGIGYLPWIYPLYKQVTMVKSGFWLGTPSVLDLRNLIYQYLAKGQEHNLSEPALYIVFVLLLIRNWFEKKEKTLFLILWFLLPILLTWIISQRFTSIFYNRYLLYTIPAAMLVVASNRRAPASNIILFLLIGIFAVIDFNYFTHPTKLPFRQYAEYVKSVSDRRDYLINWNSNGSHHLWETKYYGIGAPIYSTSEADLPYFVGTALMEDSDVTGTIPEKANTIGVVTSGAADEVKLPNFTQVEIKEFSNLKYILLKRQDD